jgi:hypothetical protein
MALFFVGPRSIGGAVSYVRMSDVFALNGRRILESVQALEPIFAKDHAPTYQRRRAQEGRYPPRGVGSKKIAASSGCIRGWPAALVRR